MAKNKTRTLGNIVYSTNKEMDFSIPDEDVHTLAPEKQNLRVGISKKGRGGKTVTLIENFIGNESDLEILARMLKSKCGVGGSAKDGEILIHGDHRDKIVDILIKAGYKAKKSGG